MSTTDYEKHLKIFFSPDFKVQPGSEETHRAIAELLAENEVWNLVLKKTGMKRPKTIDGGKLLTTCDPKYTILLNHFLQGVSYGDTIIELQKIMKSKSMARYVYSKNKANVEATANFLKKFSKL